MSQQLPPHDLDAERAVLSAIMLDPDTLGELSGVLAAEDFYDPQHRLVFGTARDIDESGARPDAVTVAGRLKDSNQISRIGGVSYLYDLVDATPSVGHAEDHARIVAGKARVRRVQDLCRSLVAEGFTAEGDAIAWLQTVEARVYEATKLAEMRATLATLSEMVAVEQMAIKARSETKSEVSGIPTGFRRLDRHLNGLKRGGKYVLAAVTGAGKTSFALQVARNVAGQGLGVVYASIEMPHDQLVLSLLSQESGLNNQTLERGELNSDQWRRFAVATKSLSGLPFVADDCETQSVASIRSSVRRGVKRLERERGSSVKLGLLVIDHIHIESDTTSRKSGTRNDDLTGISNGNRKLAKEFNVPVLELNQLNKKGYGNDDECPQMNDIRESGSIVQDAFCMLGLGRKDVFRDDPSEYDGKGAVAIRKGRQGVKPGRIPLRFIGECTRFSEDDSMPEREPAPDDYANDYANGFDQADDFQNRRAGE